MAPIHDRMPVILRPDDYRLWLDRDADPREAAQLMRPYPDGEFEVVPVDRLVNSPSNDVPQCVQSLA
jgi:putative SOS response-associated peptidase YedK